MRDLKTFFLLLLLSVGAGASLEAAHSNGRGRKPEVKRSRGFLNAAIFDHVFIGQALLARDPGLASRRWPSGFMPIHAATYAGRLAFIMFLVDEMGVNHPFVRPSGPGEVPLSAYDLALQGESTPEVLEYYEALQRERIFSEGFSGEGKETFENDLSSVQRQCLVHVFEGDESEPSPLIY